MLVNGKVLIYGSCGALGRSLTEVFKRHQWHVTGCDLLKNENANVSIVPSSSMLLEEQGKHVFSSIQENIGDSNKFDAILCASGGFTLGNAADSHLFKGADEMIRSSIHASLICARMSSSFLKQSGLLVLPGAAAALQATPQMLGYGAAKAYVHFLVKSLAAQESGIVNGAKVIGIAPVMLNTPSNRLAMPTADFSSWTPLDVLASKLLQWSNHTHEVSNGAIIKIETKGGVTSCENFFV
ncbi:6,7-dihydropteridine reductase [Cardiosporidium cionae]|uniref:Dihydropteridine reductase n=1 Tax=Cardiosporidium cionae TaxID=476202 RepID=A0ABQ7JA89_9APIC|nr:6,7-dihydropteridine reductase [Cardiosporidium cionae]|eukprot:KAF8820918.1 6,7-dihydropteridine reductase [Cardiosporidium cionae]